MGQADEQRAKRSRMVSAPRRCIRWVPVAAALWGCAEIQRPREPLVRIAELEIDAAHLASYKAAVTEEIQTSIRVEPGVLAIYSVTLKDNPTHVHFLEIYAD